MATLASLTLHVGASTSGLTSGMTRAGASVAGFARSADARMRTFGRSMAIRGRAAGASLMSSMSSALSSGSSGVVSRGRSAGSRLMSAMGSAVSAGASGLGSVMQMAAKPGLITAALSLAAAVAGAFGAGLVAAFSGVAVVGIAALILKNEPAVKRSMGRLMDTAKGVVKDAAKPMIQPLADMFDDLRGTVKDLGPDLRKMFKTVADSGLTKSLSRGIDGFAKGMLDGFNQMLSDSKPVFDAMEKFLRDIGEGLGGFFKGIGWASDDAATGLHDLGVLLKYILTYVGYFLGAMAKYYAAIRAFVGHVINAFVWLYNTVVNGRAREFVEGVGRWFAALPGRVLGILTGFAAAVAGFFGRIAGRAVSLTRGAVSAVVGFFAALPGRAADALGALAGAVAGRMSAAAGRLLTLARNGVTRTVAFVATLPGKAGRALGSLAGTIAGRMSAAGTRMVGVARDKVNRARDAVAELPSKAKGALGDLGGVLWNAGASLISGFIDGIRAKIPDVAGTLGGLTSKLTSWKGPESLDKRILTPAGTYVMDGFVAGIEKRIALVRSTLSGVTSDLPGMAATASVDSAVQVAAPKPRQDRLVLDSEGADEDLIRLLRKWVKLNGGGDVQTAFGSN